MFDVAVVTECDDADGDGCLAVVEAFFSCFASGNEIYEEPPRPTYVVRSFLLYGKPGFVIVVVLLLLDCCADDNDDDGSNGGVDMTLICGVAIVVGE